MRRGSKRTHDGDVASDSASVNSCTIRKPLPDDLDAETVGFNEDALFPDGQESPHWDGYDDTLIAEPDFPRDHASVLDDASRNNLKSMIDDSCLAVKPTFKFKMPWERKGLSMIFNRDPAKLIPTPVMSPIDFDSFGRQSTSSSHPSTGKTVRGAFSDVIDFRNTDISEKDVEDSAMNKALEKWYKIFATGREAWPRGFDLSAAVRNHRLDDMRLVFGSRSHGTLLRRGSSILQYVEWYKSRYFSLCPFPLTAELVEEYVQSLNASGKPASNLRGFVEAVHFCQHVIGMDVSLDAGTLISAKVHRIIESSDCLRKEKVQARVLTVKEVEHLEIFLSDERMDITDRTACGAMLFCLYSRSSRWSDIRRVYNFVTDMAEREGKISGYVECRTRSHKTARLVAKGGLSMPLVAPVWGVTSPPWGLAFVKVLQLAGRAADCLDHEPLLAAPTLDGKWSSRAVTTKEGGKWLRNLLSSVEGGSPFTSIHTLKATPLSWCAKWGLDPDTRSILGHHTTGKSSAECYGRDNLAKPLRELELVLQQIRTRAFSPDSTRSGMIGSETVADPRASFSCALETNQSPDQTAVGVSSDSESSSSSSPSDGEDSASEAGDNPDPVIAPRQRAPDVLMYRNIKSRVVHVVAVGGAESFSCGVRISDDFEQVDSSPFLEIRKCKRCEAAKPIKTVGQMASSLEKLRKGT